MHEEVCFESFFYYFVSFVWKVFYSKAVCLGSVSFQKLFVWKVFCLESCLFAESFVCQLICL